MHSEALQWLTSALADIGPVALAVDVGGRDINGTVRPHTRAEQYVCVDLVAGKAVDVVADITDWEPPAPADLVVCAEVLEHAEDPEAIVAACGRILRPGGTLLLTAAADPRAPHSAVDGAEVRPGEHYANIAPGDLKDWLAGWSDVDLTYDGVHGDVYARATKPAAKATRR